jgi:hypothetical protein
MRLLKKCLKASTAALLGLPTSVFAQDTVNIGDFRKLTDPIPVNPDYTVVLAKLINEFLFWAGIIAFLYVLYGGFLYLTAGGDSSAVNRAKGTIINAAIGVVIISLAYFLIRATINTPECFGGKVKPEACLSKPVTP